MSKIFNSKIKNNNIAKNHQSFTSAPQKRPNSQLKYQKIPDIITQVKPPGLNNIIQPVNPHKSALTPTNHSTNLIQNKNLLPQKSDEFLNKKTLILDLDETLVHSSFTPFEKNDIILSVDFEGELYNIYVLVRPGTLEFLKKVSQLFEVIIFTASISKYALPLMDILDKENKIKYRLTREHCTFINGIYIKELKKLNRNLKDLIIVDNSPLAYAFDAENGIPIRTWYDDENDEELFHILPILEFLSTIDDVRDYIYKFVYNNEIQFNDAYDIINESYNMTNICESSVPNVRNVKISNNKSNKGKNLVNLKNNNSEENKITSITVNVNLNMKNKMQNKEKYRTNNNFIKSKVNNNISININPKIKMYKNNSKKNIAIKNNVNKDNNNIQISIKKNMQIQRKKNAFRLGPKTQLKYSSSNIFTNNNNCNNNGSITTKNNHLNGTNFPLTLSLSNTTKNLVFPKKQVQYKTSKEKKTVNKIKIENEKDNIRSISFKELLYEKKICKNVYWKNNIVGAKKKKQYSNLLENFENNKTFKSQHSLNGFSNSLKQLNTNSFQVKNKKGHLRVSSYINVFQSNNNKSLDNKMSFSFHVTRSKSTGNFLKFTNRKNWKQPKTPKNNNKLLECGAMGEIKKNKKVVNIIDGFGYSKTDRYKSVPESIKCGEENKCKNSKNGKGTKMK